MTKILSDIVFVNRNVQIEDYLKENFGEIVRWAIVDVAEDKLKISFSYEVKEVRTN